jgi:uncharacterized protein (TIGR01777 family)
MNIAISGIAGLVGRALTDRLLNNDHCVTGLVRADFESGKSHLLTKLEGVDAVIHLAGAPILKRWTSEWKETIFTSRVNTTSLLVSAINEMVNPPRIFISASAVGIYDTFEVHDEYSTAYGEDFLSEVCMAWESEATKVNTSKVRLSILRLGVVLSARGGALKKMLLPFKMGVGGKIGDGLQPMPFIHIDDLTKAIEWLIHSDDKKGIFNMVAPQMISNIEFTKALTGVLNRPAFFTVPEFVLRLFYGDASQVLTEGQKVVPKRLPEQGFRFDFTDIQSTLTHLLNK